MFSSDIMADDVIPFPKEKVYPATVRGREVWDQIEPPPEMVWAVCPWMRRHMDESRCNHCPRYEEIEHYGTMQRGCYGIAAEVCRVVFAMQRRGEKPLAETTEVKP